MKIEYIRRLLKKYLASHNQIKKFSEGLTEKELNYKPAPDKWSVREIINHLCDSEIMAVSRMQNIIAQQNSLLVSYDQDEWANKLAYRNSDDKLSLAIFGLLRKRTYNLLLKLPESAWTKTGIHTERGKITLLDLLKTYAVHGEKHLLQMKNILKQKRR